MTDNVITEKLKQMDERGFSMLLDRYSAYVSAREFCGFLRLGRCSGKVKSGHDVGLLLYGYIAPPPAIVIVGGVFYDMSPSTALECVLSLNP